MNKVKYDKELEAEIRANKIIDEFKSMIDRFIIKKTIKHLQERTIEENISKWEKKFKEYQENQLPTVLQKMCMNNILRFRMEKIYRDHCGKN